MNPWLIGTSGMFLLIIVLMCVLFSKSRNAKKNLESIVQRRTSELSKQHDFMYLVNHAAALLLETETENIYKTMVQSMDIIGRHVKVDYIYIWQNYKKNDGELHYKLVYKWMNEGITGDDEWQTKAYYDTVPRWLELLSKNECINGQVSDLPNDENQYLSRYGIQSVLVIPIFLKDFFWGFASFDDCHKQRKFPEVEVSTLRSWCLFAIGTIQRFRIAMELEEASRAKSAFLARMSHEIRTPMNAIIGMAELAMREEILPSTQQHIMTIRQAGTNLLSIINDILDFSKIETGKLEIIPMDYLLSSLINDVINIIKMKVLETRLRFIVNVDGNMPNELYGDAVRIRQVLLNLLSNAVKYTEKGFISLSITGEMTDKNIVVLTMQVEDSGKGIKQEDREKLFTEFTRFDMTKNVGVEGTGLGLVITRNLVKAMNGEIEVQSAYGEGSTFTVTLPQTVINNDKLAVVENPEEKNVLIFERRDIFVTSIIKTMDNLSISYKLVSTESEFYDEVIKNEYSFIFLASVLYERIKKRYADFITTAKVLLITEFGESIIEQNASTITTPIFSLPIANSLNGVTCIFTHSSNNVTIERFKAPTAKVLVVDDINTNLQVVEGLLRPYEIKVDVCKNGITAIEMIKSENYDAVFMDHIMPEMDGIEATALIRELGVIVPYYKELPIIALTANAVSGTKEMFYKHGFNDFLPKPIDTIQLYSILERWIPKEKQVVSLEKSKPDAAANLHEKILINGLDTKKGIATAGGSLENYLRTLSVFLKDGEEKIKDIKECLEADNINLYTIYVHALKGAASNIGADGLSGAAKALETAGRKEDMGFIHAHNGSFLAEIEMILNNISEALKDKDDVNQNKTLDIELLKAELNDLKAALAGFDSVEIKNAVKRLGEFTQVPEVGVVIDGILKDVLIGEYDEANILIDSLL